MGWGGGAKDAGAGKWGVFRSEKVPFILTRAANAKRKATVGYRYPCGARDSAGHSADV